VTGSEPVAFLFYEIIKPPCKPFGLTCLRMSHFFWSRSLYSDSMDNPIKDYLPNQISAEMFPSCWLIVSSSLGASQRYQKMKPNVNLSFVRASFVCGSVAKKKQFQQKKWNERSGIRYQQFQQLFCRLDKKYGSMNFGLSRPSEFERFFLIGRPISYFQAFESIVKRLFFVLWNRKNSSKSLCFALAFDFRRSRGNSEYCGSPVQTRELFLTVKRFLLRPDADADAILVTEHAMRTFDTQLRRGVFGQSSLIG